jgi:hypothetical protein
MFQSDWGENEASDNELQAIRKLSGMLMRLDVEV